MQSKDYVEVPLLCFEVTETPMGDGQPALRVMSFGQAVDQSAPFTHGATLNLATTNSDVLPGVVVGARVLAVLDVTEVPAATEAPAAPIAADPQL